MKHVILAFLILVLVFAAGVVLYPVVLTKGCNPSIASLGFSGGALLMAVGLAVPMSLKAVIDTVSTAKIPKIGGNT